MDRAHDRVFADAARYGAFHRPPENRIVPVRDGGDAGRVLLRSFRRIEAREFCVRPFLRERGGIGRNPTLDNDFGRRRDFQRDRFAVHEIHRFAPDGAHHVILGNATRHGCASGKAKRRLPADDIGDRHFVTRLLVLGKMSAPVLRSPQQDGNFRRTTHHASVNADIVYVRIRVLGHAAGIGQDIAPTVEPVPFRDRKFQQIDIVAGKDVLLHRTILDGARFDTFLKDCPADAHKFARGGVLRQAEHHRDARIAGMAAGENPRTKRVGAVVILDVGE